MSDGGGFRFSHAVGLLLPIIALPIGWWVGNAPIPDPKPAPPVVAQAQAPSTARTQQRPAGAPSVRMTVAPGAEPAPVAEPAPGPPRDEAPAGLSQWTTIDRALEESRRNGKPVFIDFSADWCGPCQQLKQQVFDDGTRAHALQSAAGPRSRPG